MSAPPYLSVLTPTKAFRLFAAALLAGIGFIVFGLGPAWMAGAAVLAYGAALAIAQQKHFVALSGTVKDSPYFLGFMLTMISLAKIFYDLEGQQTSANAISANVVGEAGAAILVTVAGLFMRQLLTSLDPGEDARDAVFQSIASELRERTVEFHETQARFVGLLKEFVSAKESLFSREEAAFEGYVERLERGAAMLGEIGSTYPARLSGLLDGVAAATKQLTNEFSGCAQDLEAASGSIAATTAKELRAAEEAIAASGQALIGARARTIDQTQQVVATLSGATTTLAQNVEAFSRNWADYIAPATAFNRSVDETISRLRALQTEIAGSTSKTSGMAEALSTTASAVEKAGSLIEDAAQSRAAGLRAELQAIDGVIDEFVSVLRKRINQPLVS
jgi:hypothetical protein